VNGSGWLYAVVSNQRFERFRALPSSLPLLPSLLA